MTQLPARNRQRDDSESLTTNRKWSSKVSQADGELGHNCTGCASLPGSCFKVLALGQGSSNSSMVNKRLAPDNFRADSADAAGVRASA